MCIHDLYRYPSEKHITLAVTANMHLHIGNQVVSRLACKCKFGYNYPDIPLDPPHHCGYYSIQFRSSGASSPSPIVSIGPFIASRHGSLIRSSICLKEQTGNGPFYSIGWALKLRTEPICFWCIPFSSVWKGFGSRFHPLWRRDARWSRRSSSYDYPAWWKCA